MSIKGVYCLTSPNGKKYVGIGMSKYGIENRWKKYRKLHCKKQVKLYNALKKYGPENFKYEIILKTNNLEKANRVEKQLISLWNLRNDKYGYNITCGGEGVLGLKKSKESNEENSKRGKERYRSGKQIPYWLGKKRDIETNKKISITKTGIRNLKGCSTYKIVKNGNFWIINDLKKFCFDNGLKYNSMLSCACGIRLSCYGYFIEKIK